MIAPRKRRKVSSACQRCRERKLGCDTERPCQLCIRAGVECVPRNVGTTDTVTPAKRDSDSHKNDQTNRLGSEDTVIAPESNILNLTTMMFVETGSNLYLEHDTSALPGGAKPINPDLPVPGSWRDLVGVELPPDDVLDNIVRSFFLSVDWFMMVFHEESFKGRYKEFLHQQSASHDSDFVWICMLVIALGAHYMALAPPSNQNAVNYRQLAKDLLANIETRFLQIVNCSTLETVQICILLGSFFLFNGRPNAGLGISGSGVKIAQVIGLHRESLWKDISLAEREERRRTWWALDVFDKYAAIAFGRPCIIDDSDCDVGMVSDIQLGQQMNAEDSLIVYHQWKFQLYRIMGLFLGRRRQQKRAETVYTIHQQLLQWRKDLPESLQLESYDQDSEHISLLQMQALNLQLTYDNLQIILHRTAAFQYNDKECKFRSSSTRNNTSLQQLLDSAMEISELYKYSSTLHASRRTHADMHIGITLFTAGVVLCAICLSHPITAISSRAKTGVMHIIRMCRNASSSNQHLISTQSLSILDSLVTVVLRLETDLIIGRTNHPAVVSFDQHRSSRSIEDIMPIVGPATPRIDEANLRHNSTGGESLFQPIREVFGRHISQSTPMSSASRDRVENIEATKEILQQPTLEAANTFDWNGDLSFLVDSDLLDASQLWLWADNLNYDSLNDIHNK
ncbi:fungal-specific transcription factor domain-containing protein [Trichoderma evansii]